MRALPKISLVTPSYNQVTFLDRTIRSVLDQNYPALEYLIIDGGSTDGSVEVIKKYANRLAFWVSERDGGQSEAINKGLKRATGEILGWLNSDDTLAPNALWRIAKAYKAHPEADLIYGYTCLIDAHDHVTRRLIVVQTNANELIRYNRDIWSQPGTTWRRRLQDKIGLLDESLQYTMDCDLWIRAALAGTVLFIPYHFANLRIHPATKSMRFVERFRQEHEIIDKRYGAQYHDRLHRRLFRAKRLWRALTSFRTYCYYFDFYRWRRER